jgi:hypothetical protein
MGEGHTTHRNPDTRMLLDISLYLSTDCSLELASVCVDTCVIVINPQCYEDDWPGLNED